MSKEKTLAIINEQEVLGKQFRVYGDCANPLFLAKDVAEWIEHSNSRSMLDIVEANEKVVRNVYTLGGNQESWFLTEDGLYEILMQSRKPIAKQFKKAVKQILKDIRKNGGYVGNDELFIDTYLPFADEQTKLLFKTTLYTVQELNKKVEILTPKAEYHDEVLNKDGLILSTVVAKDLGLSSANQLHKIMNLAGIIFKKGRTWVPYRDYEWLIKEQYADFRSYKQEKAEPILMWTEKGRKYIIENYNRWTASIVSA